MLSRYVAIYLILAIPGCTCNDLAGPEAQLTRAAHALEQRQELELGGERLAVRRLRLTRLTPEPELHPPRVVFQLDLEGTLASGTRLSVLALERQPMVWREGAFVPQGPLFPALQAALARLPPLHAERLVMRVELRAAQVTAELPGGARQSFTVELPALSPDGGPG